MREKPRGLVSLGSRDASSRGDIPLKNELGVPLALLLPVLLVAEALG